MKDNFFEGKQRIEEEKFIQFAKSNPHITKYEFTPLGESYDVKFKSGSTYFIGEIKVRDNYSTEFFDLYGPFLELKKVEGMQKKVDATQTVQLQKAYFNFANNGVQVFLLNEPWKYNFSWRYLPKDNENTEIMVWKMVATLQKPIEVKPYSKKV